MKVGSLEFVAVILLSILCIPNPAFGIRVVIKSDSSWHNSHKGVDLVFIVFGIGDLINLNCIRLLYELSVSRVLSNSLPFAIVRAFGPFVRTNIKVRGSSYNIQFEQHWLDAQTERQKIVNDAMSITAVHKALCESAALVGASVLQVYLLRLLFERKLGMSQALDIYSDLEFTVCYG
ncbi:hypothetical protein F3Y22_tig00110893pilonHSYRG01332 [Hibiscus syriacus]|uniref:ABC transmembrane type-1 domain-containing protein n=1 Tax=Hibiscus syriacus TaxID=106335 RepID=A0A6A2ZHT7_HIBSY|nr:hypothetical protein F3Y22_tig00110893pilonHSYRG01332 [Hibiscus syriacus]